jgi:hypothetical protein
MLRVPNKLLFHHTCISGATLGKGFYRGIGTVLGGGLGCIAAILGEQVGGIGNPFIVGVSLFIFGNVFIIPRIQYQQKKKIKFKSAINQRKKRRILQRQLFFFSLTIKFLRPTQLQEFW